MQGLPCWVSCKLEENSLGGEQLPKIGKLKQRRGSGSGGGLGLGSGSQQLPSFLARPRTLAAPPSAHPCSVPLQSLTPPKTQLRPEHLHECGGRGFSKAVSLGLTPSCLPVATELGDSLGGREQSLHRVLVARGRQAHGADLSTVGYGKGEQARIQAEEVQSMGCGWSWVVLTSDIDFLILGSHVKAVGNQRGRDYQHVEVI